MDSVESGYFKSCSKCGQVWQKSKDFVQDQNIKLTGYQVNFIHPEKGLLLFNHMSCQTTLGIFPESLMYLYNGPVYTENRTGSEECPGYCLQKTNFTRCPVKCNSAFVREVIEIIDQQKNKLSASR
jgi:hypothetical protein